MNRLLDEGNLQFDFSAFRNAERFDDMQVNGMKAVDFVAEDNDCMYFVEVKDFQDPNAPAARCNSDYKMLVDAGIKRKSIFSIEMGVKIKDSLLRNFSLGKKFTKKVVYLLLVNLDKFGEHERGRLKEKINGRIPTGLNNDMFCKFSEIKFDLVNREQLKKYRIICTEKQ